MLRSRFIALQRYSAKYLRKSHTFRSNCFIKMLLEIPKQGFNRKAIDRHVAKYLNRLESHEQHLGYFSRQLEIIPYEKLWEFALRSISMRPIRQTKTIQELRELHLQSETHLGESQN